MDLQMVRTCVLRSRYECDCLWIERVAHIHDRIAVAEHVADKGVSLMQDNLHAIGPATLVVTREKFDVLGGRCVLIC